MHFDPRQLRAVIRVADDLSFSRAAEHLNISQPALSAQVQKVEKLLGFPVFDRSTRRVALTTTGRRFVDEARRVVSEGERLARFVAALRRQARTHLAIGTPIYTIDFRERIRFLESLIETCTDLDVEVVTGLTQAEIGGELATGQLDLAVLMGVTVPSAEYQRAVSQRVGRESLINDALRRVMLAERPVELLVPARTRLAALQVITPTDLAGERVAVLHAFHGEAITRPIGEYLDRAGAKAVLPPEPNAIGVERYGRQFHIPAITLGWFPQPNDGAMVRRPLSGLDLRTQLVLAGHPETSTPASERAYAMAESLAKEPACE